MPPAVTTPVPSSCAPLALLDCRDHLLHVFADPWAENTRHDTELEVADRVEIGRQIDVFDVDLVGDDGTERRERFRVASRDRQAGQRLAHPAARRPCATADDALHTSRTRSIAVDERRRFGQVARRRPVGEVHAGVVADETAIHGFGRQRQQRRGDLTHRGEHRPEDVERNRIARPESFARPAHVPVGQRVEERADRATRCEQVVRVHRPRDVSDKVMHLAEDVLVERVVGRRCGVVPCSRQRSRTS